MTVVTHGLGAPTEVKQLTEATAQIAQLAEAKVQIELLSADRGNGQSDKQESVEPARRTMFASVAAVSIPEMAEALSSLFLDGISLTPDAVPALDRMFEAIKTFAQATTATKAAIAAMIPDARVRRKLQTTSDFETACAGAVENTDCSFNWYLNPDCTGDGINNIDSWDGFQSIPELGILQCDPSSYDGCSVKVNTPGCTVHAYSQNGFEDRSATVTSDDGCVEVCEVVVAERGDVEAELGADDPLGEYAEPKCSAAAAINSIQVAESAESEFHLKIVDKCTGTGGTDTGGTDSTQVISCADGATFTCSDGSSSCSFSEAGPSVSCEEGSEGSTKKTTTTTKAINWYDNPVSTTTTTSTTTEILPRYTCRYAASYSDHSCRYATFSGESNAKCKDYMTCSGAYFTDSSSATCTDYDACKGATFSDSSSATCDGPDYYACHEASFTDSSSATCTHGTACKGATFSDYSSATCTVLDACIEATFSGDACCTGGYCPSDAPLCSDEETERDEETKVTTTNTRLR